MLKKTIKYAEYTDNGTRVSGESSVILDVLNPDIHKDLLRSFNFVINNFSFLLNEFAKYTDVIHFDDINKHVLMSLETEYQNFNSLDFANKKRNALIKRNAKLTQKSQLENIVVQSSKVLKSLDHDFMGKVLYLLYINLFEEDMKIRLAKIKISEQNQIFQKISHDGFIDPLAKFLVSKEGLGDDYLFLFPLLKKIKNPKVLEFLMENFEGTRQKELISIFKKEIKGGEYITPEASLDLFGMQSLYKDRLTMSTSFENLLRESFLENPNSIKKITNVGAIEFNTTSFRKSQIDDLILVLKQFHDKDEVIGFLKEKMHQIESKTEETLTLFEVVLFINLRSLLALWAGYKERDEALVSQSLKILGRNLLFVDEIWEEFGTVHNTATNKKMDPFINVTLNIGDNYLEKQGKIALSSSVSGILGKYKSVLSLKRISDKSQLHEYAGFVKQRRSVLKKEQTILKKEIATKVERIHTFFGSNKDKGSTTKVLRFKLQLLNKVKSYIVNKIILDNVKDVDQALKDRHGFFDLQVLLSGILNNEDQEMLDKFLYTENLVDTIKKEQITYNSHKFLSIHIAPGNEEDFFYDITNRCAELNHPIYKWKTEFEAGLKFYVNTHANIMPMQMSEYLKKAVFEKFMYITDEIYKKFIFTNYDRSQFNYKKNIDNYILFFDIDEYTMKKIISKKIIEEFLHNNTFLNTVTGKPKATRTMLENYVVDVKSYLNFLLKQ